MHIIQAIKEAARQAAGQMINEMNIDTVIDKIYTFPAEIRRQEGLLADARRRLEEAKSNLELARQVTVAAVISETNGDGKPRYSNDKAREAEITRRLAADQEYRTALDVAKKAEDAVNSEQFEMNRLYNEFSAYKAVSRILAGKLNLVAGL
jgi:hypothetical protein